MIEFSFEPQRAEYIKAQQVYSRYTQRWLYTARWIVIIGAGVLCTALLLAIGKRDTTSYVLAIGFLLWLVVMRAVFVPFVQRYALGKSFDTVFKHIPQMHVRCDDVGIETAVLNSYQSSVEWATFRGWTENESMLLLIGGGVVRYFPKRALTNEQLQALRELVAAYVPKLTPGRKLTKP